MEKQVCIWVPPIMAGLLIALRIRKCLPNGLCSHCCVRLAPAGKDLQLLWGFEQSLTVLMGCFHRCRAGEGNHAVPGAAQRPSDLHVPEGSQTPDALTGAALRVGNALPCK